MIAAKNQDTDFSGLMKELSTKFANLDTQSQPKILELLEYVKDERKSMAIDYVEEEATEERKLYNQQLVSGERDLKGMCTKLGPIYKEGDALPPEIKQELAKIKRDILNANLFSGHTYKDRFGKPVRQSFKDRTDYLMTQARMHDGIYTVDANHAAIVDLRNAIKKAKFDSMLMYLRDGKRTIKLDDLCRSIISNKSQTGEDLKYPFTEQEVRVITTALESRKPTK